MKIIKATMIKQKKGNNQPVIRTRKNLSKKKHIQIKRERKKNRIKRNENWIALLVCITVTIPIRIIIEKIDIKPNKINITPNKKYMYKSVKKKYCNIHFISFSLVNCVKYNENNTDFVCFVVYLQANLIYLYSF